MVKVVAPLCKILEAPSWYRSNGPLSKMHRDGQIDLKLVDDYDWASLRCADVAFFTRPATDGHVKTMKACREFGTKIWVDMDANLLNVPTDHPSHDFYNSSNTRQNLNSCLGLADVVTVASEALEPVLAPHTRLVRIIPSAFDSCLLKFREKSEPQKVVMWRGDNTHVKDLMSVANQIGTIFKEKSDWNFIFVGFNPWFLIDGMEGRGVYVPPMDFMTYMEMIGMLRPSISIVPMVDNGFNRCRATVVAMEASFAGAEVIVPALGPEWAIPGARIYRSPENFLEQLRLAMDGYGGSSGAVQTFNYFSGTQSLAEMNSRRMRILQEIMG